MKTTLTVQEDPDTKELYIQLTDEMLAELGWKEGDTIKWTEQSDGSWVLTKQKESVKITDEVTPEEEEAWRELEKKQTKA
jgi:formylmethanofuran dehydrogenase subunit D